MNNTNKTSKIDTGSKMPVDELEREAVRSRKLKCVLTKLLSSDFKLSDDTLIEKLFTVLLKQFNERNDKWKASDLGIFIPWLFMAFRDWGRLKRSVKVFTLRLAGLSATLKSSLKTLFDSGLFKNITAHVMKRSNDQSILYGYMDLMYSIIKHNLTCNYILDNYLWRNMIYIALNSKSLYTTRRSYQCIASLIVSLSQSHSVNKAHEVLDACFYHLRHRSHVVEIPPTVRLSPDELPVPLFPEVEETQLMPAIQLSTEIISELLNKKVSSQVISNLISRYGIKDWCWNVITEENEDIEVINSCSKLLAYINATSITKTEKGEVTYTVMRSLTLEALKQLNLTAQKHMFTLVLDVCIDYQTLWAKHGAAVVYSEEDLQNETWELENNLIITQCMPLFICMKVTRVMESDVMDMFANKVFTLSCKETQRVCYTYRDCLREAPDRSLEALCLQGIRSFFRIPSCFTKREQAVMSFQCMMHTLKEFVPEEVNEISADCIVAKRTDGNLIVRFPNILSALLDGLSQFITTFRITWQDSLETVCILTFIQTLANKKDISPMLCAKALQLAKHVIAQFIPPNLALLVDTLKGSSMENLGNLLRRKINEIHWEVRDSALELLLAITNIAKAQFPAFQSLILDNDLPPLVLSLVLIDPNSFVRVSAVACLSEMVKIQNIWDSSLFDKRVTEQLMKCILQDTEGIVRKQAALLINDIYVNQIIPPSQLERLLDVMCHVSEKDLCSETKIASLEFWTSVIERSKNNQGMLDGEFPPITFSAQKKKIITLDRNEIRSRLALLLNNLSSTGCLQILWTSVKDDCDLGVSVKAKEVVDKLIHLLDQYDAVDHLMKMKPVHDQFSKSGDVNITFSDISQRGHNTSSVTRKTRIETMPEEEECHLNIDDVIEQTVSKEDVDLVKQLSQCEVKEPIEPSPRTILRPLEFLDRVLSLDSSELEHRQKWILETSNGFDSILEDIMAADLNTNVIDCY